MHKVLFYCLRHGQAESAGPDSHLTVHGRVQVAAATHQHIVPRRVRFDYVLATEAQRTQESAEEVLRTLGQEHLLPNMIIEPEFGLAFPEAERLLAQYPWEVFMEKIQQERLAGRSVSVQFVLNNYPPAELIRQYLTRALLRQTKTLIAQHTHESPQSTRIIALVAGHATSTWAVSKDMRDVTPGYPPYAHWMHYEAGIHRDGSEATILHAYALT